MPDCSGYKKASRRRSKLDHETHDYRTVLRLCPRTCLCNHLAIFEIQLSPSLGRADTLSFFALFSNLILAKIKEFERKVYTEVLQGEKGPIVTKTGERQKLLYGGNIKIFTSLLSLAHHGRPRDSWQIWLAGWLVLLISTPFPDFTDGPK